MLYKQVIYKPNFVLLQCLLFALYLHHISWTISQQLLEAVLFWHRATTVSGWHSPFKNPKLKLQLLMLTDC